MNRLDIINHLIATYHLQNYIEIGVHVGEVLNGCIAKHKVGVDPDYKRYKGNELVYPNTSDVFFEEMPDDIKADIIFIDGFHEASQVFRDIINSLNHLSDTGYIIVHDCNPPIKWHTRTYEEYKNTGGDWNGDVYAGYINACKLFGLTYFTVDIDWGVGIIISPKKEIEKSDYKSTIEWDYFNENRKELLNLITIENFKSLFS